MHRSALLLCSALLLAGCLGGNEDPDAEVSVVEEEEALYFEPIGHGQSATLADTTGRAIERVIRDAATWAAYQDSLRPLRPFEPVDFAQAMVLVAAFPVTSGGHTVLFESVGREAGEMVASYVLTEPGNDCLTSVAEAVPFQAVLVRRTDEPVRFARRKERYPCTLE